MSGPAPTTGTPRASGSRRQMNRLGNIANLISRLQLAAAASGCAEALAIMLVASWPPYGA
eukprot:41223-Pyramimonas_sp.AAC.1